MTWTTKKTEKNRTDNKQRKKEKLKKKKNIQKENMTKRLSCSWIHGGWWRQRRDPCVFCALNRWQQTA